MFRVVRTIAGNRDSEPLPFPASNFLLLSVGVFNDDTFVKVPPSVFVALCRSFCCRAVAPARPLSVATPALRTSKRCRFGKARSVGSYHKATTYRTPEEDGIRTKRMSCASTTTLLGEMTHPGMSICEKGPLCSHCRNRPDLSHSRLYELSPFLRNRTTDTQTNGPAESTSRPSCPTSSRKSKNLSAHRGRKTEFVQRAVHRNTTLLLPPCHAISEARYARSAVPPMCNTPRVCTS